MPLHDWSKLPGWEGVHDIWIVELLRWIKPRLSSVPTIATRLGGNIPSEVHNRREVMPGLWVISDRIEKSTGRRSYIAMRCRNKPMMDRVARRVL